MCVVPGEGAGCMKSTISLKENDRSEKGLDSLCTLKPDQLAERWHELYGTAMPALLRRSVIIQALAYRLQEKAFGGLKPATRRLLESVAGRGSEHRTAKSRTRRSAQTGTVLVREWHGTKHQVTVLKDGFIFKGKHSESLSKIAREITGTRWSGPLFFGLRSRQEREHGAG
jgi:Protein of unknown function (DUF2924)